MVLCLHCILESNVALRKFSGLLIHNYLFIYVLVFILYPELENYFWYSGFCEYSRSKLMGKVCDDRILMVVSCFSCSRWHQVVLFVCLHLACLSRVVSQLKS